MLPPKDRNAMSVASSVVDICDETNEIPTSDDPPVPNVSMVSVLFGPAPGSPAREILPSIKIAASIPSVRIMTSGFRVLLAACKLPSIRIPDASLVVIRVSDSPKVKGLVASLVSWIDPELTIEKLDAEESPWMMIPWDWTLTSVERISWTERVITFAAVKSLLVTPPQRNVPLLPGPIPFASMRTKSAILPTTSGCASGRSRTN